MRKFEYRKLLDVGKLPKFCAARQSPDVHRVVGKIGMRGLMELEQVAMETRAHPRLIELNAQKLGFAAEIFQEGAVCGALIRGHVVEGIKPRVPRFFGL